MSFGLPYFFTVVLNGTVEPPPIPRVPNDDQIASAVEFTISEYTQEQVRNYYLTISRRRRGDYKPIFTEPRSGEVNI